MAKNKHKYFFFLKTHQAFTLLELLIVIAVISLLAGVGFARYNEFTEKKLVENELKKFQSVIDLTAERARTQDNSICSDNSLDTIPTEYNLTITTSEYTVSAICEKNNIPTITPTPVVYKLKKGEFLLPSWTEIKFAPKTGKILNYPTSPSERCFGITVGNTTKHLQITNEYGNTEIKETCP